LQQCKDLSTARVFIMVIGFQGPCCEALRHCLGCRGPFPSWLLRRPVWAVSREALAASPRCKVLQRQFRALSREALAALPRFPLGPRHRDGQTFQEEGQARQVAFKKEGSSYRFRSGVFFHCPVSAAQPSALAHEQHGTPLISTYESNVGDRAPVVPTSGTDDPPTGAATIPAATATR
jgi:hypothetical protein